MANWIGYMVSINCVNNKGTFQGEILTATGSTLTLAKAFCNGTPCPMSEVTIKGEDIADLKLIDKQENSKGRSTVIVAKPVAKRAARTLSTSESVTNKSVTSNGVLNCNKPKLPDIEVKYNLNESSLYKSSTPSKKDKSSKVKWNKKDEACFGSPIDQTVYKEFDFEKNLALFDKQAVWEEINAQKPDVIRQTDQRKNQKYRHDENIIATKPTTYRQITVPKQECHEYVTDDGLVIPGISPILRAKLWGACLQAGITLERRAELMGRAATEMALQLLGGGHRLNPHNMHQYPTVVVLCAANKHGALGINAARQMASHGVNTVLYVHSQNSLVETELCLYKLTKNKVVNSIFELPQVADLIIIALCEENEETLNLDLVDWINGNKAPVLALDPPSIGTPGVSTKYSLVPALPLAHSPDNGKIYLCNIAIPVQIYYQVGIKYKSPFGSKFVIPLHPNES